MSYGVERRPDFQVANIFVPRKREKTFEEKKATVYERTIIAGMKVSGLHAVTSHAANHWVEVDREFKALSEPDDALLSAGLHDLQAGFIHKAVSIQTGLYGQFGF